MNSNGGRSKKNQELLSAYGLVEMKRNSKDMVEAAFEGRLDEVKELIEKGYHHESEDSHKNTPLSEAACAGIHLLWCR